MALADDSGAIPAAIPIVGPAGLSIVGPVGPAGPAGPQGPRGLQGSVSPSDLQAAIAPVDGRVALLEQSRQGGYITRQTYAEIAALTLSATATYQVPETDTGTHAGIASEAGYVGGQVPNTGTFAAIGDPLVLRRTGGLGTAAIPGIQANVAGLQKALSSYRPGDILASWTAQVDAPEATATSLTVGGQFALVDGADGRVLRVTPTGSIGVGPIHCDQIYADRSYEYTLIDRRVTDGTTSTVLLRLYGFTSANVAVGPATIITQAVVNADGLQKPSVRLTGAAILALLPGAVKARPYVSLTSAAGTLDISAVSRGTASDLASATSQAAIVATIPGTQLIPTLSADRKTTTLIAYSDLEALLVEQFYDFDAGGTATLAERSLIPADAARNGGEIIHGGPTGTLYVRIGDAPTKIPLQPGSGYSLLHGRKSEIFVSTDGPDIPMNAFYTNRSNKDVIAARYSDAYIAKLSGAQTATDITAIRKIVDRLRASGALQNMTSARILAGRDQASSIVDLVRLVSATVNGAPIFSPGRYVRFNGTDASPAYLDTGYLSRDDTRLSTVSHSMGCYVVDNGTQGGMTMGTTAFALGANRSSSQAAFRSANPGSDLVTLGRSGFFGFSRSETPRYRAFWNKTVVSVETPAVSFGNASLPILVGALGGATPSAWSSSDVAFDFTGMPMTDAQMFSITDAVAEYLATLAGA